MSSKDLLIHVEQDLKEMLNEPVNPKANPMEETVFSTDHYAIKEVTNTVISFMTGIPNGLKNPLAI